MSETNSSSEETRSSPEETNAPSEETQFASDETRGAVQHLEDALAAEDPDEVNYHVRQALQLLDVERTRNSSDES